MTSIMGHIAHHHVPCQHPTTRTRAMKHADGVLARLGHLLEWRAQELFCTPFIATSVRLCVAFRRIRQPRPVCVCVRGVRMEEPYRAQIVGPRAEQREEQTKCWRQRIACQALPPEQHTSR